MGTKLAIKKRRNVLLSLLATVVAGGIIFSALSRADTPFILGESENGSLSGAAQLINDPAASGTKAVAFGSAGTQNILNGKTFTADVADSASESGSISNMTDNNDATRWISNPARPVNAVVDMQGIYSLERIQIVWAADTIKNYSLAVSMDGSAWTTIGSGTTNNTPKQAVDYTAFTANAQGRYLRITGTDAWNTTFGNSIWEVRAYGRLDASVPTGSISAFNATAASGTSTNISWAYNGSSLTNFTLKRDGVTIASPAAAARSYTDSGLTTNKNYTYSLSGTLAGGGTTNVVTKSVTVGTALYNGGILSITFDDGTAGQYTNALPSLRSHGFKATYFLISNTINAGGYISAAQAKQLVSEGHEVASHSKSHPDMRSFSAAQADAEYAGAQTAIQSLVGITPKTCSYPYGAYNATIDSVVRKYFRGCRSSAFDQIFASTVNLYDMPNYAMGPTSTTATVKQLVDRSVASKSWTIITFHQVGSSGDLNVTPAMFNSMMDTIQASGIRVMTVNDALTAIGK